jgi:hypothetical protein
MLPVANAWHQLDRQEVRQAKDRFGLALRIGMKRVRANLRAIFQQTVKFPD